MKLENAEFESLRNSSGSKKKKKKKKKKRKKNKEKYTGKLKSLSWNCMVVYLYND